MKRILSSYFNLKFTNDEYQDVLRAQCPLLDNIYYLFRYLLCPRPYWRERKQSQSIFSHLQKTEHSDRQWHPCRKMKWQSSMSWSCATDFRDRLHHRRYCGERCGYCLTWNRWVWRILQKLPKVGKFNINQHKSTLEHQ
jgi:hypothetical protein